MNESFKLAYIPELIERKVGGTEKGRLEKADVGFHQREYERLRGELEQAYWDCKLPEAPRGAAALHDSAGAPAELKIDDKQTPMWKNRFGKGSQNERKYT